MLDLSAVVGQSAVDKLVASIALPFPIFELHHPFQGRAGEIEASEFLYPDGQWIGAAQVVRFRTTPPKEESPDDAVARAVAAEAQTVIDQARRAIKGPTEPEYRQDIAQEIQKWVDQSIGGLGARGIQFKANLAYFRASLDQRPNLVIGAPRIGITGVALLIDFSAELWWYHPVPCWDWPWNWPWKWDRVASFGLNGVKIAAAAHIDLRASGSVVMAQAAFDQLRLDYVIIRDIPLEGLANGILASHSQIAYDASKLILAVPLIGSRFQVSDISIPQPVSGQLGVELDIKRAQ